MRRNKRKRILIIAAIMMTAIIAVGTGLYFISPGYLFKFGDKKGAAAAEQFTGGRLNVVLLGFDGDKHRGATSSVFRTDTIMIASLDLKTNEVSLVSIPRDSYVKIAGLDRYDKINHSFVHGYNAGKGEDKHQNGIDTVIRTVEDFLGGIPIQYYVAVDMDGVAEVVDRVGGVYFDVEHTIRGDLLLYKGRQLLNGRAFLVFVRDRSVGGDFGRASRQQQILIEAFQQIKEKGKLRDIPALFRSLQNNIETNLSAAQIAQLALIGMKVKPDQITSHVFTGNSQLAASGGLNISYVVIDEKKRVQLIREAFGMEVAERPQPVLPAPLKRPSSPEPSPSAPLPSAPLPQPDELEDGEGPSAGEDPPDEGDDPDDGEGLPPEDDPGGGEPGHGEGGEEPGEGEEDSGGPAEGEDPDAP
ncbi:MAG: LCP family protein [Firmicutes bacterium]|nr:LCP family protein [Bacillota bacterium]